VRGSFQHRLERLQDWVTDALTSASPPRSLRAAVERSDDTRFLLVTAGDVVDEGHAAAFIAEAAPDRVERWEVPDAGHTDGYEVAPDDWQSRVVAFLRDALDVPA
jgi:hypothetical protein